MTHTLILFLPVADCTADSDIRWLLLDDDNQVVSRDSSPFRELPARLAAVSDDYAVVAIAPSETVLSVAVDIPSTQQRQIRQALPFMVEELIADDIDNVHTAIPVDFRARLPRVDAAVVQHKQLIEWLDLLHSHQLSPSAILVDALCLPFDELGWTLLVDNDRLLVRREYNQGIAIQLQDAEMLLTAMLRQEQQQRASQPEAAIAPRLHIAASRTQEQDCASADMLIEYLSGQFPDYELKSSRYQEPVEQILSYDWEQQKQLGINLLQGGYALATQGRERSVAWGRAAAVAAIGIAVYLLVAVGSGWYFNFRAQHLEQQSVAIYRKLFPTERRVVNPRKQMQNHLRQSGPRGNGSFLALLAETARQMQQGSGAGAVKVNQIRFDSQKGELRFELTSRSLEQLDQLKSRLVAGGLKADINSASEQDGSVLGRIVVSPL